MKKYTPQNFTLLSSVSLTPLINNDSRISPWIFEKIWNGTKGTLSGLGDTDLWKKNLKLKISCQTPFKFFDNVNTSTQRCPNKILKTFLIEDCFICHWFNNMGGAPWAANISANFRKNLKRTWWDTQGLWGNWFMEKPEVENLVALSL